jgi:hypothetical protein
VTTNLRTDFLEEFERAEVSKTLPQNEIDLFALDAPTSLTVSL